MRAALWLVLLLVAATALAGCSKPRLADRDDGKAAEPATPRVTTEAGADVSYVGAPTWHAGWHFAYEGEGAYEGTSWRSGLAGNRSDADTRTWGPREEYNYTVVQANTSLGETRFIALQAGPAAELTGGLLVFDQLHLKPRAGYVTDYCNYSFYHGAPDCTPLLQVIDAEDEAPPLDFPLRDGPATKDLIEESQRPFIPLDPIMVSTRILGLKEVEGPFGAVQAVHVHQEFAVNFTRALATWGATADEQQTGQSSQNLTGSVRGVRDVYYAPTLSNVVLDLASSEGVYNGSYVQDGHNESFRETWSTWSRHRLVNATFEERVPLTTAEISARLRTVATDELPYSGRLILQADNAYANVADGEAIRLSARTVAGEAPARVSLRILDATGATVFSVQDAEADFRPGTVGPYLAVAEAFNATGASLGVDFRTLGAYYQGDVDGGLCDPVIVRPFTGCPAVPVPIGPVLSYVSLSGSSPTAFAPLSGELVLDLGNGQSIHGYGYIFLESPRVDPEAQWTLRYQPEAGAAQSASYGMDIWPGALPSFVYQLALGDQLPPYYYY